MAHVMKFTKAACGHMFKHYERAKDKEGEYVKFENQDIDTTKSYLNYNLAPMQINGQGEFVKERCSEVKLQNRKDVNVMCSWVVTAPKEIREDETETFFKETYKFLSERYGKENVVSAYVHMDETTPHIHFAFVPVVTDKKKGIQKVSAKEAIDRNHLRAFHTDLSVYMEKVFGRDVGILNEATVEGNKTIEELKRGTLIEQAQEAHKIIEKAEELQSLLPNLINDKSELERNIKALRGELEKVEGKILTAKQVNAIDGKIPLLGDKIKDVTYKEYFDLKKTASTIDEVHELEKKLKKKENRLNKKEEQLNKWAEELEEEAERVRRLPLEIQKENNRIRRRNAELETALSKLPEDIRVQIIPTPKEKAKNTHEIE